MKVKKPQLFRSRKRRHILPNDQSGAGLPHRPARKVSKRKRGLLLALSIGLIAAGLYMAYLLLTPQLPILAGKSEIDLNTADDATDNRDRIQIEKINLEVPFFTGGPEELDKGSWHRYPDRGDPEQGGNFILSAHRFSIGTTPAETKKRSPFYNLDKLKEGDTMRIFFKGKWYTYTVTKKYSVKPNATEIEAPSETSKLTLYSCSLGGSADGRIVIEATTKDGPEKWQQSTSGKSQQAPNAPIAKGTTPSKPLTPAQAEQLRKLLFKLPNFSPSQSPKVPKPSPKPVPSSPSPTASPSTPSPTESPDVSPQSTPSP
ncbi:MAG: sortase [Candidatus Saccharibacteria bacterium]